MERELQEGGSVWVKLPYGDFIIEDTRDIVLIAGGTGITAFMAFLADATPDFGHSITLGYGARSESLLLYRDMIEEKARSLSQFRCIYFVEQPHAVQPSSGELQGRISAEAVWKVVRDPAAAVWYLSGPPLMLKTLSKDLGGLGVAAGSIKIDAWE
jgi:ferredoxin-NADP reductase